MVGLSRGSAIPTKYGGTMAAAAVLSVLMYSCCLVVVFCLGERGYEKADCGSPPSVVYTYLNTYHPNRTHLEHLPRLLRLGERPRQIRVRAQRDEQPALLLLDLLRVRLAVHQRGLL